MGSHDTFRKACGWLTFEVAVAMTARCSRETPEQRAALSRVGVRSSQHPTLRLNPAQPVSHRGDPAEVFEDVPLADEADWDYPAGRERDRGPKHFFEHEDARSVMPEGPVPEVSHVLFAGVEPFVQVKILTGLAAVLPG
jgi:hypothetical protein